jgi:hypothetical protein
LMQLGTPLMKPEGSTLTSHRIILSGERPRP